MRKLNNNNYKNKFRNKLALATWILLKNMKLHKEIWDKEIDEKDGWLKPSYKTNMTKSINILTEVYEKFKDITPYQSEADRLVYDAKKWIAVSNSNRDKDLRFNFGVEKETLPYQFLDSLMSYTVTFEYLINNLVKTIEEYSLEKEFSKLKTLISTLVAMMEDELLITAATQEEKERLQRRLDKIKPISKTALERLLKEVA